MKSGLIVSFIFIVSLVSCSDIINTNQYNITHIQLLPTEAAPLAYGALTIQDILSSQDSQYVKVYPDGLVYLEYVHTLKSQAIRDLIKIDDKDNIEADFSGVDVPSGAFGPVANDFTFSQKNVSDQFDLSPEKFKEILLKSGNFAYQLSIAPSNNNLKFVVRIVVPEFTDPSGNPLTLTTSGNSGSLSLVNYKYTSGTPNGITVQYFLIMKKNPNVVVVSPATTIKALVSFKGLDFVYAKGFLGTQSANLDPDEVTINAFGNSLLSGANVSFANPMVSLDVLNEVGVPTDVTFLKLEARKPGSTLPVQLSSGNNVSINFPSVMGDSAATSVTVSNSKALLDFRPKSFFYQANATINPTASSGNNFVTDTSKLKVRMHVTVPLYGSANNIVLSDTASIDLSGIDQSEIASAEVKVKGTNQIPLDATLQFYLTDDNYTVIDSLMTSGPALLIKASTVDGNGELLSAGVIDQVIPLSSSALHAIFDAQYILIKARVNTTKNGNTFPDVKFKSNYRMNVKIGLKVKAKVDIGL